MNVRKPTDYRAMFKALDNLIAASLPQMKLYCEVGRLVSARSEKGAAVAAAEYLGKAYPDIKGFSPRNLRRMRDFYRTYESSPEILAEAMTIGWTQNAVILENCDNLEERVWYIRRVQQFSWTKAELLEKIHAGAYLEIPLDLADESCYAMGNAAGMKSAADNKNSHCPIRQRPDDKKRPGGGITNRILGNKRRPCLAQPPDQHGPGQPSNRDPRPQQRFRWKPPPAGYYPVRWLDVKVRVSGNPLDCFRI